MVVFLCMGVINYRPFVESNPRPHDFIYYFSRTPNVGFLENNKPENKSLIIIFPEHLYLLQQSESTMRCT